MKIMNKAHENVSFLIEFHLDKNLSEDYNIRVEKYERLWRSRTEC